MVPHRRQQYKYFNIFGSDGKQTRLQNLNSLLTFLRNPAMQILCCLFNNTLTILNIQLQKCKRYKTHFRLTNCCTHILITLFISHTIECINYVGTQCTYNDKRFCQFVSILLVYAKLLQKTKCTYTFLTRRIECSEQNSI